MHLPADAQEPQRDTTRTPPDTVVVEVPLSPAESLMVAQGRERADTTAPRDTIKAPLAQAPLPTSYAVGTEYRWDRDELFASGAVTLLDLLERVPGVTSLYSGWIATPQVAAYLGDVGRVRIFIDGLEIDPLDPRDPEVVDLGSIPLWPLESVVIERGAGELRVHARTWSVRRTTANTRTDVFTGDAETNIYRGFFGRRFQNGAALQFAGQQLGTEMDPVGGQSQFPGGGDQLELLGRLGWARGLWAADAFLLRSRRTRQRQSGQGLELVIPELEATRTTAYLRGGYGNPDEPGPWAQLIAAHVRFQESTEGEVPDTVVTNGDTMIVSPDTSRSRAHYVATAGWTTALGVRVEATGRLRVFEGQALPTYSARGRFDRGWFGASVFGEYDRLDTLTRVEGAVRFTPLRFLALTATAGVVRDDRDEAEGDPVPYGQAELGLRIGRLWTGVGAVYRDSVTLTPLETFGREPPAVPGPAALGAYAFARGQLWRDFGIEAFALRWDEDGFYRPQLQTHSRLIFATRWLDRFPTGNFGVKLVFEHSYRDRATFPTATDPVITQQPAHLLSALLEIRILEAILSWQIRNLTGQQYELVPGFIQQRPVNLYGVRWEFWN